MNRSQREEFTKYRNGNVTWQLTIDRQGINPTAHFKQYFDFYALFLIVRRQKNGNIVFQIPSSHNASVTNNVRVFTTRVHYSLQSNTNWLWIFAFFICQFSASRHFNERTFVEIFSSYISFVRKNIYKVLFYEIFFLFYFFIICSECSLHSSLIISK